MRLYNLLLAICNRLRIGVTEVGSSGGWTWRKYSDGTVDMWFRTVNNAAITNATGSIYATNEYNVALPFDLSTDPKILVGSCGNPLGTAVYFTWLGGTDVFQTNLRYHIMCARSATLTINVSLYVHGKLN